MTRGPKPELVRDLGASYHTGSIADLRLQPHIVIERTGAPELILLALGIAAPGGIICLPGEGPPMATPTAWGESLATMATPTAWGESRATRVVLNHMMYLVL